MLINFQAFYIRTLNKNINLPKDLSFYPWAVVTYGAQQFGKARLSPWRKPLKSPSSVRRPSVVHLSRTVVRQDDWQNHQSTLVKMCRFEMCSVVVHIQLRKVLKLYCTEIARMLVKTGPSSSVSSATSK